MFCRFYHRNDRERNGAFTEMCEALESLPKSMKLNMFEILFVLFDLILYVHSTIFQLCGTVFLG